MTAETTTMSGAQLPASPSPSRRWVPLAILAALMALVFAMGWHQHLTTANLVKNYGVLQTFIAKHHVLAIATYIGVYIAVVALSLPGGLVMTLSGGILFGWIAGALSSLVGATIGAVIIFLVAKTALGESMVAKAGPWLGKLRTGFQENALSYLLFLRLVPAFPFALVNLAAAVLGVPFTTYVIGTFFGIMPATAAFSSVGAGLAMVVAEANAAYQACIAAKGAACGEPSISLGAALLNRHLLMAFAFLGVVALIPVAYKKWSRPHARNS
jgi:uncharacterized membrane protein YdjX (TVP38/TMEM64 family)